MKQTILITGGTGKIGRQLVKHFAQKGHMVVFTGRHKDRIASLESECNNVVGICVDFSANTAIDTITGELSQRNLQVTSLINCARDLDALRVEPDGSILSQQWHAEYQIDVVVPYMLSMALSKTGHLKRVVNIASMYGIQSFNPHLYDNDCNPALQYACAKAALIHLTKCLAVLLANKNITVNCISYGGVEGRVSEAFKHRYAQLCPLKRMMTDIETIPAADYLIDGGDNYITGQNIVVDGGWGIW